MPYASLCDLMRFMMRFDAGRVALAPRQSPRNAPRIGMPWTWQSSSIDAVDSEQHKAFGANVSNVSNIYIYIDAQVLMTLDDLLMFFQDPRAPKRAYYWHHLLIRTSGRYLQYLNLGHNTSIFRGFYPKS